MNAPVTPPLRVLVVEDHAPLREELVYYLTEVGHQVQGLDSPLEIDDVLRRDRIDVMVLDLNLPFEDGLSVAQRTRSAMPGLGIIVLSGRIRSEQKIEAYHCGIDMFPGKPAAPQELALAIQSLARRLDRTPTAATWQLDAGLNTLTAPDGQQVALTSGESGLLRAMAVAPERILCSTEHDRLDIASKRALESSVSRLRTKLTPLNNGEPCIKVLWGRGYQLLLHVTLPGH